MIRLRSSTCGRGLDGGGPDPEGRGARPRSSRQYGLIPLLKLRLGQPGVLVDLRDRRLDGIIETDDGLRIGARADPSSDQRARSSATGTRSLRRFRAASATRRSATGAQSAARWRTPIPRPIGRPRCSRRRPGRRRGTWRRADLAAREFFIDTFTTAIEPTEVLTEVRIPRAAARTGAGYSKTRASRRRLRNGRVAVAVRLGRRRT